MACGTVSTTALPTLQKENDIPMLGVVEPACRKAVEVTRNKKVGLIATAASVRSGAYERAIHDIDPTVQVIGKACPLFVPMVENGRYRPGDAVIELLAREYLAPLKEAGVDTLIMGCTHYPLLSDIIAAEMGPGVQLLNVSREAVCQLKETLTEQGLLSDEKTGEDQFFASDITGDFQRIAHDFLGADIGTVGGVDIDAY